MKIRTNFTEPRDWLVPVLVSSIWMSALAMLLLAIYLMISGMEYRSERSQLETRLTQLQAQAVARPDRLPSNEILVRLRQEIRSINTLTGQAGMPLASLLTRLEKLIPPDASLVSLSYRARDGEAKLLVTAAQSGSLTRFMERLEQSGDFSRVLLTRQSSGPQNAIQFEIQLYQTK